VWAAKSARARFRRQCIGRPRALKRCVRLGWLSFVRVCRVSRVTCQAIRNKAVLQVMASVHDAVHILKPSYCCLGHLTETKYPAVWWMSRELALQSLGKRDVEGDRACRLQFFPHLRRFLHHRQNEEASRSERCLSVGGCIIGPFYWKCGCGGSASCTECSQRDLAKPPTWQ
jgi:hypothetical protein